MFLTKLCSCRLSRVPDLTDQQSLDVLSTQQSHLIIGNKKGRNKIVSQEMCQDYHLIDCKTTSTVATLINGVSSVELLSGEHVLKKEEENLRITHATTHKVWGKDSDAKRLGRGDRCGHNILSQELAQPELGQGCSPLLAGSLGFKTVWLQIFHGFWPTKVPISRGPT